jgi:hypothetical protein
MIFIRNGASSKAGKKSDVTDTGIRVIVTTGKIRHSGL